MILVIKHEVIWYDEFTVCDVMKCYEWYEQMIWIPTNSILDKFLGSPEDVEAKPYDHVSR